MTLSINLPNLHYDKQMFKYPTRATQRGQSDAEPHVILSRICTVSTRYPLKQVQNGEIVKIHALHPLCNFCCIGITTSDVKAEARCIPQTAQRNHVAARCCFPPPRSMIQGCQIKSFWTLSVRNKTPGELSIVAAG